MGSIYASEENGPFRAVSKEDLRTGMNGTWDFITKHSIYGDSICCYVLSRDGAPKDKVVALPVKGHSAI